MSALIEVRGLKMHFPVGGRLFSGGKRILKAVDGVDFSVERGQTFAIVGESGCGKTTAGRAIVRLYKPTAGEILFEGTDLAPLEGEALLPYRRRMQMIFQDPYASLNPRMTIGSIVTEPMCVQGLCGSDRERLERARELIERVGLKDDHLSRYPHEFSGGQRQRIGIARALSTSPDFIVCDEPISALDVSIQAQVVNMLEELQQSLGLTYLFVSHDLSMVRHISHEVAVMYLGQIVEIAPTDALFRHMQHPYTVALLSAVPVPDPDRQGARIVLEGDVPTPIDPPPGCPFLSRCRVSMPVCKERRPELVDLGGGHRVACHRIAR
ncbi:MAG: ATP-binding cassette domain-containing protein [Clostridiales bacterium]|nr:ATP-binding cassette domain-containing protein [Clostridiales bacterium]